jgi:hypothetical protein
MDSHAVIALIVKKTAAGSSYINTEGIIEWLKTSSKCGVQEGEIMRQIDLLEHTMPLLCGYLSMIIKRDLECLGLAEKYSEVHLYVLQCLWGYENFEDPDKIMARYVNDTNRLWKTDSPE